MFTTLVLDLGSSSTRAIAFDERARAIPGVLARQPVTFVSTQPGQSDDDPPHALARARRVLAGALQHCAERGMKRIDAVAIASYAGSLLALDAHGEPVTNIITYADTRAAAQAARLRETHNELDTLQRTGCRIRANYAPARLAWLRENAAEAFAHAAHFVSMSDFVRLKIFGDLSTSLSIASWNGLLNRANLQWDEAWLGALGVLPSRMPRIDETPLALRGLGGGLAALNGAVLLPAIGDGAAANIGSGSADASNIAVTVGTTAAMRIVTSDSNRAIPPALWQYRIDHARGLTGGALSEGGNVVAWLRDTLVLPDPAALEAELARMPPDTHGLTILPLIAGERSPGYSDAPGATVHGITMSTTPVQIAQAWMESVSYRLALVCDALRPYAAPTALLIASGGALFNSPSWCRMIANATGLAVQLCEEPEATARGAALIAAQRLQPGATMPAAPLGNRYDPNPEHARISRSAMTRQAALYNILHEQATQKT